MEQRVFLVSAIIAVLVGAVALVACGSTGSNAATYRSVSAQEAKELMETETGYVILDVREADEYAEKHIPGAVLLPVGQVEDRAEIELPMKKQLILVYCRAGNRSKTAAEALAKLGYTNVVEFGGINEWPYETE